MIIHFKALLRTGVLIGTADFLVYMKLMFIAALIFAYLSFARLVEVRVVVVVASFGMFINVCYFKGFASFFISFLGDIGAFFGDLGAFFGLRPFLGETNYFDLVIFCSFFFKADGFSDSFFSVRLGVRKIPI